MFIINFFFKILTYVKWNYLCSHLQVRIGFGESPTYNIIFETPQSLETPSSTPGRDRHYAQQLFCKKFNAQQLLSEEFFDIIAIFGSIEPLSESTFSFHYNIIFKTYQSLEATSCTFGEDRHMHPLTFLYEI